MSSVEVWISSIVKEDPVINIKVGGYGMVFDSDNIGTGRFYSPVTHNPPRHVAPPDVDIKACAQALNLSLELDFKNVTVHSDSMFLRSLITKFLIEWKENDWMKSDGTRVNLNLEHIQRIDYCMERMEVSWDWLDKDSPCCGIGADQHRQDWDNRKLKRQDVRESFCRRFISQELAEYGTNPGTDDNPRSLYMYRLLKDTEARKQRVLPLTHLVATETTIVSPEPQCADIDVKMDQSLSVRERKYLKTQINKKNVPICVMNSPFGFGKVIVMRTVEPFSKDGSFKIEIHTGDTTKYDQTLILEEGTIVACAFSGCDQADEGIWARDDVMVVLHSRKLVAEHLTWEFRESRDAQGRTFKNRRKARTKEERKAWIETVDRDIGLNMAVPGGLFFMGMDEQVEPDESYGTFSYK